MGDAMLRPVRMGDRDFYGERLRDPDVAVAVEAQSRFLTEGRMRLYLVVGAFLVSALVMFATAPI